MRTSFSLRHPSVLVILRINFMALETIRLKPAMKNKKVNLRVDLGFGNDGNSGIYFGIEKAF